MTRAPTYYGVTIVFNLVGDSREREFTRCFGLREFSESRQTIDDYILTHQEALLKILEDLSYTMENSFWKYRVFYDRVPAYEEIPEDNFVLLLGENLCRNLIVPNESLN